MTNQELALADCWKSKSHTLRNLAERYPPGHERDRLMGKVETLIECAMELEELPDEPALR